MKRKNIDSEFINECKQEFEQDPVNIISKNAIHSVGSILSSVNSEKVNKITHMFTTSLKRTYTKATNQGASGRCWMFAGLNMLRHPFSDALKLGNFEYSQTYLFFWDKLERSNTYLEWFIDHPEYTPADHQYTYMLDNFLNDGGWWNNFASIVAKYGLVPASTMKESFQSGDSAIMNSMITKHLNGALNVILQNRHKMTRQQLDKLRMDTIKKIYNILVKYLGQPPEKFQWVFPTKLEDDDEPVINIMQKVTPSEFRDMVVSSQNILNDFVVLSNIPTKDMKFYTKYTVRNTNNISDYKPFTFYNVKVDDMAKYAMLSIEKGLPVWFACDVMKSFNMYLSALDDELDASDTLFGEIQDFDKGQQIYLHNIQSTHAMVLTGFNTDKKGNPTEWQVENSWGFIDDTPGADGFLMMSHSWFKKYVIQIVVNKNLFTRSFKKGYEKAEEKFLEIWDSVSPALRVNPK